MLEDVANDHGLTLELAQVGPSECGDEVHHLARPAHKNARH